MTNQQIQNLIENILEDYDLELNEIAFDHDQIEVDLIINDQPISFTIGNKDLINPNQSRSTILHALADALDDYDIVDELDQLGISEETIDQVENQQDTAAEAERTYWMIKQELKDQPDYTNFQEAQLNELNNLANSAIQEGYLTHNLAMAKNYIHTADVIAQSEPLYNALQQIVDPTKNNANVFFYAPNFFNFISSGRGEQLLNKFQTQPKQVIEQIIKENYLETK